MHRFFSAIGAVQFVFLAASPQPGADMLGQHHNGLGIEQATGAGLLEIGRQLAMQARQALVVAGKQLRFDAQQIAPVCRDPFVQGDLDAQVGEVMADGPVCRPGAITEQCSQGEEGDEENQEFTHGTGYQPSAGVRNRVVVLRTRINKLSFSVIEPVPAAL
ncbi:hypothetical protein D3C85_1321270 [compost metagenome]